METNNTYEYDSVLIAKYIIALAHEKGVSINMTKLQKLLYISYGICLAVIGKRLVNEHPQAWPYGPVFPRTRNKLLKLDFYTISVDDDCFSELRSNTELTGLLNLVFDSFGSWNASQLTEWSHDNGSPWERTVEKEDFSWGERISDEDISSYFKLIVVDRQDD